MSNENPKGKRPVTKNRQIFAHIRGCEYDRDAVVARELGSRSMIDTNNLAYTDPENASFCVVKKELKKLGGADTEKPDVGTLNVNLANVYPGSLLLVNRELAEGKPVPIVTKEGDRKPIELTIDLNGAGEEGTAWIEDPTPGNISTAVDEMVEAWAAKGNKAAATIGYDETMVYSETQLEARLGVKGLGDKLGINFSDIEKGKKKVYVKALKQVYYNVNLTPSNDLFTENVDEEEVIRQIDNQNPAGIITSVAYGRMVYIKLESSETEKKVEEVFKAAFSKGSVKESVKDSEILKNATFSAYVFGGTAGKGVAVTTKKMEEIIDLIVSEAEFKGSQVSAAKPISYSVSFLKDNKTALISSSTEYVETTVSRYHDTVINLKHRGAYVIKEWFVEATEILNIDDKGNLVLGDKKKFYSDTSVATGKDVTVKIPANYTDYTFGFDISWGSDWPYKNRITSRNYRNIDIRVGGTTYGASCEIKGDGEVIVKV